LPKGLEQEEKEALARSAFGCPLADGQRHRLEALSRGLGSWKALAALLGKRLWSKVDHVNVTLSHASQTLAARGSGSCRS